MNLSPGHLLKVGGQAALVLANQRGPAWMLQPSYRLIAESIGLETGAFLDVGCGAGWLALYVANGKPELDAVGIDTDELALGIGERNRGTRLNVTLRNMDPARIVYPDSTFHAAAALGSFRRWSDPAAGLVELHRVLVPGARLHLYEFDAELDSLPEGWVRSPGWWMPERLMLVELRRRGIGADAWAQIKEQVQHSPFGGGEDGRHGPFRRLILTRVDR